MNKIRTKRFQHTNIGLRVLLTLSVWALVLPALSAPATYGLTSAQIAQLKSIAKKIMIPAMVPPGFKVLKVSAKRAFGEGPGTGNQYQIYYINAQSQGFAILGDEDCMGGNWSEHFTTVEHPQLGKILIYPRELEAGKIQYITSFINNDTMCYSLVSPFFSDNSPGNKIMSEVDVRKIVQSLKLVSF